MNAPLINYIVFCEETPNALRHLAATSPLNAAKDFVLQNKAGVSDAVIAVRAEADLRKTKRFQNIGGSWSEIPALNPKADTGAGPHLPASSSAKGSRTFQIRSVSIVYAALYGGVGFCLVLLVQAMFVAAFTFSVAAAAPMIGGVLFAIVAGALYGAVGALLYNVIAAVMGGLRVELADVE